MEDNFKLNKSYRLVEVNYQPWDDYPWYVVRTGSVPDRSGFHLGREGTSFKTLDAATSFINNFVKRDLEFIQAKIDEKESTSPVVLNNKD